MHRLILNVRLLTLAVVAVAVVLAAGSLAPRQTSAEIGDIVDPSGVYCADIEVGLLGIILVRFDYDSTIPDGTDDTDISLVSVIPDEGADCQDPQSQVPNPGSIDQSAARPSLTAEWNVGTQTIHGELCTEDFTLGNITLPGWSLITLDLANMSKEGKTVSNPTFSVRGAQIADTCGDLDPQDPPVPIEVNSTGLYLDGPAGDKATYDSDWDKDGCLDWDELDPAADWFGNPFNPADCPVGGIAQLPDVAATPLEAGDSSGSSAGMIAVIAAAVAAGAVTLAGTAWYARKRWATVR